jgi:hypothetical protein
MSTKQGCSRLNQVEKESDGLKEGLDVADKTAEAAETEREIFFC